MDFMFSFASEFYHTLGSWNTSNVTNMMYMFNSAIVFNNNNDPSIGSWNTSNVTNMDLMFNQASVFSQDISGWIVTLVTPNPMPNFSLNAALTNAQLPPAFRV